MARFVLVHGGWHGAWCWREIVPRLRARGHEAVAIDLPGHGEDPSPPEGVMMQDYVDRTIEAVNTSTDAPILVGHCLGGAIVSQVAEFVPDRIRALVCVAAAVPPNGACIMQLAGEFNPEYLAQIQWAPDRRTARLNPEGVRTFLYSQCPAGTVESALPHFGNEPVAPYETPLCLTEAALGAARRYYVECLLDRVVPVASLRAMRPAAPSDHVYSLDADHSPFFSAPEELTRILHTIACGHAAAGC